MTHSALQAGFASMRSFISNNLGCSSFILYNLISSLSNSREAGEFGDYVTSKIQQVKFILTIAIFESLAFAVSCQYVVVSFPYLVRPFSCMLIHRVCIVMMAEGIALLCSLVDRGWTFCLSSLTGDLQKVLET